MQNKVRKDISIFCNNCIGAFVAHDFNLPFNSPTVNLMIPPADFIEYVSNLDEFNGKDIIQIKEGVDNWPKGLLGNKVHIHFIHYKTFEDGVIAWNRRACRINKDKMFFILVETDGCSYDDLKNFDNLPYLNKIALTHKHYPDIKCSFKIKGFEKKGAVIDSYRYYKFLPKRYYDQFNWIKFLKQ